MKKLVLALLITGACCVPKKIQLATTQPVATVDISPEAPVVDAKASIASDDHSQPSSVRGESNIVSNKPTSVEISGVGIGVVIVALVALGLFALSFYWLVLVILAIEDEDSRKVKACTSKQTGKPFDALVQVVTRRRK